MTARESTHVDGENVTDAALIEPSFAADVKVEPQLIDGEIEVMRDEHLVRLCLRSTQLSATLFLTTDDARVMSKQLREYARELERYGTPD